jgi:hypothetical protein
MISISRKGKSQQPFVSSDPIYAKETPKYNLATFKQLKEISEDPNRGIVPRSLEKIFRSIKQLGIEVSLRCSFLQIYNENIYDLLSTSADLSF